MAITGYIIVVINLDNPEDTKVYTAMSEAVKVHGISWYKAYKIKPPFKFKNLLVLKLKPVRPTREKQNK